MADSSRYNIAVGETHSIHKSHRCVNNSNAHQFGVRIGEVFREETAYAVKGIEHHIFTALSKETHNSFAEYFQENSGISAYTVDLFKFAYIGGENSADRAAAFKQGMSAVVGVDNGTGIEKCKFKQFVVVHEFGRIVEKPLFHALSVTAVDGFVSHGIISFYTLGSTSFVRCCLYYT